MIATDAMSNTQCKTFSCHVQLTLCGLQYVPFSVLRATSIVAVLQAPDGRQWIKHILIKYTILVSLIIASYG